MHYAEINLPKYEPLMLLNSDAMISSFNLKTALRRLLHRFSRIIEVIGYQRFLNNS